MSTISSIGARAAFLGRATQASNQPRDAKADAQRLHLAGDDEKRLRRQARQSAEDLVAQAFVMPVLEQLRDSNHAAKPFGTTDAEKRLGPVFDGHLAHAIVRRANFAVVDQVEARVLREAHLKPYSRSQGSSQTEHGVAGGGRR